MQKIIQLALTASLLAVPATLFAQAPPDPSGHWTGAIHVPAFNGASPREVGFEVDLAKDAKGEFAATFNQPDQHLHGLPLGNVRVDGTTVSFELKANSGGVFTGTFADGRSISGEFTTSEGGYAVPFNLARTGDAVIAAAPRSAAIGKELEGTWNGAIEFQGKTERLVLKLTNQADGSAIGSIVDLDGSNLEIPVGISQKAANVTIEVAAVAASITGTLNGADLTGTWNQGPVSLPVVFTRGAK
jgi:hypothetical protein